MSEGKPKFQIVPAESDAIRVVDLGTGEDVFRPDVAETALGDFATAVECAGGELEVPDNVTELFSGRVRGIDTE